MHLDLNGGSTSFRDALQLPMSFARAYIGHDYYTQHAKNTEAEQRLWVSGLNGINGVIKAIHGLGKLIAGRRIR